MENKPDKINKDPVTGQFVEGNEGYKGKYKEEYIAEVDKYLELCKDGYEKVLIRPSEEELNLGLKNTIVDVRTVQKVKLPSLEGFAKHLGVVVDTLKNWAESNPPFLGALDRIMQEQKERLTSEGLSGNYSPLIAKLILSANHGMRERKDMTTDDKPIQSNVIVFEDYSDDEAES